MVYNFGSWASIYSLYVWEQLSGDRADKSQLHSHDFRHGIAMIHPDFSNRDASAWVLEAS